MSKRHQPIEIRCGSSGAIDEIVASGCSIQIEQMTDAAWFLGIIASDGSEWLFWFGSRNNRSYVDVGLTETIPAPKKPRRKRRTP